MLVQGDETFSGQGLEIWSPLHCAPPQHQEEFGSRSLLLNAPIRARQVLPLQPGTQLLALLAVGSSSPAPGSVWGSSLGPWRLDLWSGLLMDCVSAWWVEQKDSMQFRCLERSRRRTHHGEQLWATCVWPVPGAGLL